MLQINRMDCYSCVWHYRDLCPRYAPLFINLSTRVGGGGGGGGGEVGEDNHNLEKKNDK